MPVTYTNRKGVTYTLYRKIGADGRLSYSFGRRPVGEPVAELPPGFRISESPNGIVSLARDRPALIQPEEIAAVETAIARSPDAGNYRIAVKDKRIEVYAKVGPDAVAVYDNMVSAGLLPPGKDDLMRQFDELHAQFTPVLRFTLRDPVRRWFSAEELISYGATDYWEDLGQEGDIDTLASALLPVLSAPPEYAFSFALAPPSTEREWSARPVRRRRRSPPTSIHSLRVTLRGVRPPIWRRVEVPSDITLSELHDIVQAAMGWYNSHLHDFRVGDVNYSDPDLLEELSDGDERTARLDEVAPRAKSRLRYTYDFGDSWEHEILVEAVTAPEPGKRYPVCVTGRRACPPEDCGGIWGYADLLEAIADPANPDREELLDWLGDPFDPEAFDVAEVNERLARLR